MKLAPIILFAYNRPEHTRRTLESLKQNVLADESVLFIYIDGPKPDASTEQVKQIDAVKEVAKSEKWCKEVYIVQSETNKGLAGSVIKGVTETVDKYGSVIVMEDDLVSDTYFLKFMNDALNIYENESDVVCATGYIYPVTKPLPETFFLKGADCWGWATWKRAWGLLETDGNKLLKELETKDLTKDFDFGNSYPYLQMLKDQIAKKNNSWAILWYASAYLKNKYCLYPGHSLIHNIGVDGSGTHSGTSTEFDVKLRNAEVRVEKKEIKETKGTKEIIGDYFREVRGMNNEGFLKKLLRKIGG
jgi:glycosyltransferase involved in cell wall biosynthesis